MFRQFTQPGLRAAAAAAILQIGLCAVGLSEEREDFFERRIRPLLIDQCVACHGPKKQEGGLRLDSRQQVLNGTKDIAALVDTARVDESRLLQVLLYSDDDTQMPPKARLSDEQIAAVRRWIELGACLLYTSPSPRDQRGSRMPSSA